LEFAVDAQLEVTQSWEALLDVFFQQKNLIPQLGQQLSQSVLESASVIAKKRQKLPSNCWKVYRASSRPSAFQSSIQSSENLKSTGTPTFSSYYTCFSSVVHQFRSPV